MSDARTIFDGEKFTSAVKSYPLQYGNLDFGIIPYDNLNYAIVNFDHESELEEPYWKIHGFFSKLRHLINYLGAKSNDKNYKMWCGEIVNKINNYGGEIRSAINLIDGNIKITNDLGLVKLQNDVIKVVFSTFDKKTKVKKDLTNQDHKTTFRGYEGLFVSLSDFILDNVILSVLPEFKDLSRIEIIENILNDCYEIVMQMEKMSE